MSIDLDTDGWLGCPTPLEMYKHQCAYLEDELRETQVRLQSARRNIAGLVQMNDLLATSKAEAAEALKIVQAEIEELKRACTEPGILGMKLVAQQRDYLFRENQELLSQIRQAQTVSGS